MHRSLWAGRSRASGRRCRHHRCRFEQVSPKKRSSLLALLVAFAVCCGACAASLPATAATASADLAARPRLGGTLPHEATSLKFLVIGDSGTGDREQYDVAATIARAHAAFPFDLAIMLGDNFYGRQSAADKVNKFERPYKPLLEAGVRFQAALGNHDNPDQIHYEPFGMGGKRFYSFRVRNVEFFVLDSTKMTPEQSAWLTTALASSDAPWKIAYAHHPLYSSGKRHGGEEQLRRIVEPLFVANGVDVVFAGHEHFYERMQPQQGITYFIQGGAAKLRPGNIRNGSSLTAVGYDRDRSFTLVEIAGDQLNFETISRLGLVVDSGVFTRREVAAAALAR